MGGEEINITIDDDFSIIRYRGNIRTNINSGFSEKGSLINFKKSENNWIEINSKFKPSTKFIQQNLIDNGNQIDVSKSQYIDVVGTGVTVNKINFGLTLPFYANDITLIIRSINGDFTFGGFSDRFKNIENIQTTLKFGVAIVLKFIFFNSKYYCVSNNTIDI